MILAEDSPSLKTVCVAFFQSGQFRQPRDAALTLNKRLVVGTEVSIAIITEIAGRSAGGCLDLVIGHGEKRPSLVPAFLSLARVLVFHAGEKRGGPIGERESGQCAAAGRPTGGVHPKRCLPRAMGSDLPRRLGINIPEEERAAIFHCIQSCWLKSQSR